MHNQEISRIFAGFFLWQYKALFSPWVPCIMTIVNTFAKRPEEDRNKSYLTQFFDLGTLLGSNLLNII